MLKIKKNKKKRKKSYPNSQTRAITKKPYSCATNQSNENDVDDDLNVSDANHIAENVHLNNECINDDVNVNVNNDGSDNDESCNNVNNNVQITILLYHVIRYLGEPIYIDCMKVLSNFFY